MKPFARFALVFAIVVLALCVLPSGPFAGVGLIGSLVGTGFAIVASIVGTVVGLFFGVLGIAIGLVAMIPLLIPMLVLLSPLILFIGLIAVASRAARS